MKNLSYKEKFVQMNREARVICIVTAVIIAFWWLTAFGINEYITLFYLPLWLIVSCIGTYVLAVVLLIFAIKKFFVDFSLDEDAPEKEQNSK